jgi:16S rRNA (cytosine1402-N4)-methyltransferase
MSTGSPHIPVLIEKVIHYLEPKDGAVYIDCTFGAGGYTKGMLDAADCKVIAIDRDDTVKTFVNELKANPKYKDRFFFVKDNFANIDLALKTSGFDKVDGIVMDLGVSSMQLDQAERGFSFQKDGPLDMRMESSGSTAADFINSASEEEIANILFHYGDEKKSRKIARKIVYERLKGPITTTKALADIVHSVIYNGRDKADSATKTFQAIRIHINDELGSLKTLMEKTPYLLKDDGKIITVAFHSLEDKVIKEFFDKKSGKSVFTNRYLPEQKSTEEVCFEVFSRKAIGPTQREVESNVRARSAKLRIAKKIPSKSLTESQILEEDKCFA